MIRKGIVALVCLGWLWAGSMQATAAPVSMAVQDGDVRAVLSGLAQSSGQAIVLDGSVQGTVSIDIDGVEASQAFKLIAAAKGLLLEERDGILLIRAPGGVETFRRVHIFPVHYASAASLVQALDLAFLSQDRAGITTDLQNNKEEERKSQGRAFIDKSTNSLIFYGTDSEAEEAEQVISQLDVPARQVSLEAKVVALQKDAAKELGVEWDWSKVPQYPEQEKDYSSSVRHRVKDADGNEVTVTEDEPHYKVKRHTDGEGTPGIVQFGRGPEGHPFEFYYAAKINALLSDGKAKLLARPNIVTVQGQEASINIGGEVPVPQVKTTERETTTSLTYKQAGIILRCTPIVNDDGHITAKVHTEVSSPLYVDSMKAYRFQKREADTLVRLADGETMVIGGLIGSEEARSLSKVPFLGDLPILGAFFRNVKDSKTDSEVMIFLTARILQDK